MRLIAVITLAAAFAVGAATPASAASTITVLDTLGAATPATTFSLFGSGGQTISSNQLVGPEFTLTAPTLITEIGGFLNNCESVVGGVPQCPATMPFVVQIRPSMNGAPDARTVLATFVLSHDNQPLVLAYESASPNLVLPAGTYFALFAPQDGDAGFLLGSASDPFTYLAGSTTLGFVDPAGGTSFASQLFAAVRILGVLLPTSTDACKNNRWQMFGVFKNEGDCVSFVATEGNNPPS